MEQEQKSSATTRQKKNLKKEETKKIYLSDAISLCGLNSTKSFAARKLFSKTEVLTEKEWRSLFVSKRIIKK